MKKYKVLIITDYAAPYEGNFIESLKALHRNMLKKGNDIIYLFSPKAQDKKCVKGLLKEKYKVYFGSESVRKNIKIIGEIIKKEKISVIYTHFCSIKTQTQVKLVRIMHPSIKLISHFHNHYNTNLGFPRKQISRIAYNGDLNIGCSKSVSESLPFNKKRNIYVNNAICFDRLDNYRDIKIKELENKFVILMFGFDYYRKGVDLAIKAIKEIKSNDIVLAISISKNKEIVEENIIKDFGEVPKFVKILDPIEDIATYYHKVDVFLTSSREEGFCYSVVEAAYCKIIVVSSSISGVPKDIPGELFFESDNYSSLKKLIDEVYKENKIVDKEKKKEKEKLKDKAKEYVKKVYSIDKWVNKIIKAIEGTI